MATYLQSKPGLTGATALSIPAAWDPTWFRNFINNMLKGADVRNAVGANGITVSGTIASPYATIGFGAPVTLPGPVTINAPASGTGTTLTINAAPGAYFSQLNTYNSSAYGATYGAVAGIGLNNTNAAAETSIDFATNGVLSGRVRSDYAGNLNLVATGGGDFFFYTGGDYGTGTETARIDATYGVGANIFTNIPATESIVFANASGQYYGNLQISGTNTGGYSGIEFRSAFGSRGRTLMVSASVATQGVYDSGAGAWDWYFSGGSLIQTSGLSATTAATSLTLTAGNAIEKVSSSRRYKLNIKDVDPADADKVLKLRPVSFTANPATTSASTDPNIINFGLIAEEVEETLPLLVNYVPREVPHRIFDGSQATHKKDGTPYDMTMIPESVQYERVSVLLLDVVKRLSARVAALEAKAN